MTGGDLPYLLHLTLVHMEVLAALASEPEIDADLALTCAALHDVLEDTSVSPAELLRRFGHAVLAGVQALSKDHALPPDLRLTDSLDRIRRQPREIWMVKMADRITNLQPPPLSWSPAKVAAYREDARSILDALGDASPFLAARLAAKIRDYPPEAPAE